MAKKKKNNEGERPYRPRITTVDKTKNVQGTLKRVSIVLVQHRRSDNHPIPLDLEGTSADRWVAIHMRSRYADVILGGIHGTVEAYREGTLVTLRVDSVTTGVVSDAIAALDFSGRPTQRPRGPVSDLQVATKGIDLASLGKEIVEKIDAEARKGDDRDDGATVEDDVLVAADAD